MAVKLISACLLSYLLGSVSFSFLVVRALAGKDLRQQGTGNLGGRNVSRILGKGLASLVVLLDMSKGAAAVLFTQQLVGEATWIALLAMAAVLLGHNYSIFLGLHGGKGLAAGFGALLFISPATLGVLTAAAAVTLAVTRDVYKAALTMIFVFVPAVVYLYPSEYAAWLAAVLVAAVVMSRHMKHLSQGSPAASR